MFKNHTKHFWGFSVSIGPSGNNGSTQLLENRYCLICGKEDRKPENITEAEHRAKNLQKGIDGVSREDPEFNEAEYQAELAKFPRNAVNDIGVNTKLRKERKANMN